MPALREKGCSMAKELPLDDDQERPPLGQILIEMRLIDSNQLHEAMTAQQENGGTLGSILISMGLLSEEDLLNALAQQYDLQMVDLSKVTASDEALKMVSVSMAQLYRIVPISFEGGQLTVAMYDPQNVTALDELRFMMNCDIQPVLATEAQVAAAIDHYYGNQKESMTDLLNSMQGDPDMEVLKSNDAAFDARNIEQMVNAAPVVKFLNLVLLTAIRDQASDIHFEPFEDEFKIRYRIDGTLLEIPPPPRALALALCSRIKVMSNMDIAERRVPQDNRIELNVGGNPIDLRVSTLPTYFGESVCMRVLDRSVVSLNLERLGMREEELSFFKDAIAEPNGICLVTGPTGSGKTTTLYSALNAANTPDIKIITTEDPVEYDLDGIVQCPIRSDIGVTYAACLRSILRQDPDKILVGEIRDLESVADGTPGLQYAAHQRRALDGYAPAGHGRGTVPGFRHPLRRGRAASGAHHLREMQGPLRAVGRRADGIEPPPDGRGRQGILLRPALRTLQPHRLPRPQRDL
jgi:type IV pilus assembly protein PilB